MNTMGLLVACMIPRIARYIYYSIALIKGNQWFEKNMQILNYGIGLLSYAAGLYGLISLTMVKSHHTNLIIHIWMKLEVPCLFLEPTILIFLACKKPT
jgi:hypothetical protein